MSEKITETWITTPKKLAAAMLRDACLVHIYPTGPSMGCRYPLAGKTVSLGRGDENDITLTDHSVSRKHAQIEPAEEGHYVCDQNSTNGTFVNDERLETAWLLQDGDYVRVGNCLYRYLAGGNIEAEYHEEIYRLTILDGLTRLHNKRYLDEFLEREVIRAQRHRRPLSVLSIDIDNFKAINEQHTHLCGDFVLRELANVISGLVRQEDLLARSGGEEFVLVLVETAAEGAKIAAERIRDAVAAHEFRFETTPIPLTISIGSASTSGDTPTTPRELRQLADKKLSESKLTGPNRVCG